MSAGPRAAVVVVGSEILLDGRADTNGPFIEESLRREGIPTVLRLVVGDDREGIAAAVREAMGRAPIVIVCGGLGPTFDDLTREGAAEALGRALRRDAVEEARLRERYRARGLTPREAVCRMADVIEGAELLRNTAGTAPGQYIAGPPAVALLPGVPAEMERMLDEEALPRIRERHAASPPDRRIFKISGLYESEVEGVLSPIMKSWSGVEATILASPGDITLLLRRSDGDPEGIERAVRDVRGALGEAIYAEREEGCESAAGRILAGSGLTLATAESCTGGMLGSMITAVPGSSAYYLGGAVAYADRIKEGWLDVPGDLIARHGAVSAEVAEAMARGARRRAGADLAIAITGVAGPGGGTPEKPVGLIHIALAAPWGNASRVISIPGERATIRIRACRTALDLLRRELVRARKEGRS